MTGVCRCIDKVFMEEKTEWETVVTCEHSYNRRCAKSLITVYNSAQVTIYIIKPHCRLYSHHNVPGPP